MRKPRAQSFKFRLYVADRTPNSALAMANLTALCRTHLPGRYEIEIVDVLRKPERAIADGVFMTPALVKITPSPIIRLTGTLTRTQATLQALGLETPSA
jgi:circadian clock protein KaiB